jgi:hypothetical protein
MSTFSAIQRRLLVFLDAMKGRHVLADIMIAHDRSLDFARRSSACADCSKPARVWLHLIHRRKQLIQKSRPEVFSQNKTNQEQCGSGRPTDADAVVETETLRSFSV